MNKEILNQLFEWYGVDPARVPDYEEFWALYATSFYERLFGLIEDEKELERVYQKYVNSPKLDKRARLALTFFYNIRRDEMSDPHYWDKVGGQVQENKKYPMKAKFVNEALNENTASHDDFNKLAAELEKRRIPCKIQLTEFGQRTNIDVLCGWDYPDSLYDKVWDAMEATGVQADVSADQAGGKILDQRRIAGGPKRYQRGRSW